MKGFELVYISRFWEFLLPPILQGRPAPSQGAGHFSTVVYFLLLESNNYLEYLVFIHFILHV